MVNERYGIAMAETLHYLKGISQDDINRIPDKFMNFLKNNASQNYECKFDYTRPLKELNLKNETRGLIAMIWAAAAMGIYNKGSLSGSTAVVGEVARDLLGPVGGIIAI